MMNMKLSTLIIMGLHISCVGMVLFVLNRYYNKNSFTCPLLLL